MSYEHPKIKVEGKSGRDYRLIDYHVTIIAIGHG